MDNKRIILGSKSPRRQSLIKELGFPVEIRTKEVEEIYPKDLDPTAVPEYLAVLKAQPLMHDLASNDVLVTCDTIVLLDNEVIGKPNSPEGARNMLHKLSGRVHKVITGVCLTSRDKQHTFSVVTSVSFSELASSDISHYVSTYSPMDKAGSYAIQEWIGFIGISKIDGCYYNVMGLPLHDLRKEIFAHF